ncbi:MAG: adenylate/guanylate cyclase domain-containing protein [Methylocella sp.]
MTRERRKLAAIVALDVVGYSRLMERDERGTLATLTEHRTERLEPTLARHGGRLIKLIGDGALVEFGSVVDALNAAIEFQRSMTSANLDRRDDERIVFRIGVHVGDVIIDGDDLYGDGMNVAARLEGHAPPGGILISGNAKDAVVNRVSAEFRDLGRLPLKNIERPVQAFQVMFDQEERQGADAERPKTGIAVPSSDAASDVSSIAVRPFTVLSDDRELQFLADGLAEDVIALLARVPGFFVIAKASSFEFRNPDIPISVIAQQLGVRYVLGGSVRALGGQIRLVAQLAETTSGRVLWSGQFDTERSSAIDLQDEIARGIIVELQPALTRAEIAVIRRQRPENIGAWGFYHRAGGALAANGWNARSVEEARGFLRHALELDANFALARAQLALLMALAQNTALIEPSKSLHDEAVATAELAIADDGGSSEVLGYAGCAISDLGDTNRGAEILKQAVELDPSNAQAQVALGAALALSGDLDSGIARMKQGIKLSPRDRRLAFWGWALGGFLMRAKRPAEALEEAKLAARRDPRLFLPPVLETLAHIALGQTDAAKISLVSARRLRPELTLREIEISHGRRAVKALADLWTEASVPASV